MSKPVAPPSKVMSWDDFYEKTDNANKLMDRVWYCLAATEADIGKQKVFWEHWYWKEDGAADASSLSTKIGSNHTLTIDTNDKTVDYPVWPLRFSKESFKMYPAINLGCTTIAPFGIAMTPIQFPTSDSKTEFRVDFASAMGKKMYFIFALDPHMPDEVKAKNFETLEKDHGVLREWFKEVQWSKEYVIGSTGEPDINPK